MKVNLNRRKLIILDFVILLIIIILVFPVISKLGITQQLSLINFEEISALTNEEINQKTVLEQNELYQKRIKEDYGIDIKYGDTTKSMLTKVSASSQTNINIINNNLRIIDKALQKYPDEIINIFKQKNSKYSLTIILVDKFNNDNLALASKNSLNEFKIYLSNTQKFERALHHEMYHVIEYYMEDINNNKNLYLNWNTLNPANFQYNSDIGLLNNDYVYGKIESLDKAFFVSKYSKTSEREDRAEIFAELMTYTIMPKYLEKNQKIYIKAKEITSLVNTSLKIDNENYDICYNRCFK